MDAKSSSATPPRRNTWPKLWAALLVSVIGGCGDEKRSSPGDSEPDGSAGPVVVTSDGVSFAGRAQGPAPRDTIEKIDLLFDTLKEQRSKWKQKHPNEPFPGSMSVTLPAEISCRAAMSVLGTIAYAGYPRLTVTLGGVTHELPFAVPRAPDPRTGIRPVAINPVMAFDATSQVSVEKSACRNVFDVVPAPKVASAIRELTLDTEIVNDVTARCEPAVRFAVVFDAFIDVMREAPAPRAREAGQLALGPAPACIEGAPRPAFVDLRAALEGSTAGDKDAPLRPIAVPDDFDGDVVVTVSDVSVDLERDAAAAAIASTRSRLLGCYAAGLATNPKLRGTVHAALQIGKRGLIVSAAASGDLPDTAVIECVRSQLYHAAAMPAPRAIAGARARLAFGPAPKKK